MAEGGRTASLSHAISAAVTAGTAERVLLGDPINGPPTTVGFVFDVSQSVPPVTLVTMIAPSPDWFEDAAGVPWSLSRDPARERNAARAHSPFV